MSTFVRFAAGALLALGLASSAHAGDELHLRWDNCFSDGGTYNKLFACDTNSGEDILVGSFRLGQTTDRIDGIEGILDIAGFDPALPPWWQYQTGGCRQNSIQVSFAPPVTSSACLDPAPAGGGIAYEYPYGNGARLRFTWALFYPTLTALAGQEVFAFQLHIGRAGTVGSPACAGCNTPVCIGWGWAEIERPPEVGNVVVLGVATPDNGSNVTWQPGAVATTYGFCPPLRYCQTWVQCQSATPTHDRTWGSIKSLYR